MKTKTLITLATLTLMLAIFFTLSASAEMISDSEYWQNVSDDEATALLKSTKNEKDQSFVLILYSSKCGYSGKYVPQYADYAEEVRKELARNGVDVTVDNRSEKIGYKIRDARLSRLPYMLIVGEKEAEDKLVSVRSRFAGDEGQKSIGEFVEQICKEIRTKEIREEQVQEEK